MTPSFWSDRATPITVDRIQAERGRLPQLRRAERIPDQWRLTFSSTSDLPKRLFH
jgi:hypothetical protein